jgi:hypothetical protein
MSGKSAMLKLLYVLIVSLVVMTGLCLDGCATMEPFTYLPATEVREGPGLFSGEDGVFAVYQEQRVLPSK